MKIQLVYKHSYFKYIIFFNRLSSSVEVFAVISWSITKDRVRFLVRIWKNSLVKPNFPFNITLIILSFFSFLLLVTFFFYYKKNLAKKWPELDLHVLHQWHRKISTTYLAQHLKISTWVLWRNGFYFFQTEKKNLYKNL